MASHCRRAAIAALALALAAAGGARAEFPSKPLRIVVPYAAGGGADLLARLLAPRLAARLGQPVQVENRAGAGNVIGMRAVASADPDGHTLGLATPVFVMAPALQQPAPYDALRDFAPLAMIGYTPLLLAVHPGVGAGTTEELIALARARPGALNYASLGAATTQGLAAALFNRSAGIRAVAVPYKGSAPGVADLVAGHVQYMFNALPSMLPHVRAGRLRALAVTADAPAPQLPAVPTLARTLPGFRVTSWYALVAPARTPEGSLRRLQLEVGAVLRMPEIRAALHAQGIEPDPMSPEALAAHLAAESTRWTAVIAEASLATERAPP